MPGDAEPLAKLWADGLHSEWQPPAPPAPGAVHFKGIWSATSVYAVDDLVVTDTRTYICTAASGPVDPLTALPIDDFTWLPLTEAF